MIRFIDIGNQIDEGVPHFAWYDTIRNEFIEVGGSYIFYSWKEFEIFHKYNTYNFAPIERFKAVFPNNRKEKED